MVVTWTPSVPRNYHEQFTKMPYLPRVMQDMHPKVLEPFEPCSHYQKVVIYYPELLSHIMHIVKRSALEPSSQVLNSSTRMAGKPA